MYDCLPMHHSVGGVVAIGAPLVNGGSVVDRRALLGARLLRRRRAAADCTAFQYIGELCRYLVAAPPSPESAHRDCGSRSATACAARSGATSSSASPQVRVLEFYASTEGNFWLYNVEGRIGAIGRVPRLSRGARAGRARRVSTPRRQAPARGADGFCSRCADGEIGEALGRIGADPAARFEGYSEQAETTKKILRDVVRARRRLDAHRRSDAPRRRGLLLLRRPHRRHLSLEGRERRDAGSRLGAVGACPGVAEAIVYGVEVPGADGRAGMALLGVGEHFDLGVFARHARALPSYARPVFLRLRIGDGAETTSTFKTRGRAFAREGYDPRGIDDPLYLYDRGVERYVPLDAEVFARLTRGEIPL